MNEKTFDTLLTEMVNKSYHADRYRVIANDENIVFIQSNCDYVSNVLLDDICDLCRVFKTSYFVESRNVCGARKMVIAVERP